MDIVCPWGASVQIGDYRRELSTQLSIPKHTLIVQTTAIRNCQQPPGLVVVRNPSWRCYFLPIFHVLHDKIHRPAILELADSVVPMASNGTKQYSSKIRRCQASHVFSWSQSQRIVFNLRSIAASNEDGRTSGTRSAVFRVKNSSSGRAPRRR
jgi:hypothetical protein